MQRSFLVAKATSDNFVNVTSQIYYQNDQKNEVVTVIFYKILSTSLCFAELKDTFEKCSRVSAIKSLQKK